MNSSIASAEWTYREKVNANWGPVGRSPFAVARHYAREMHGGIEPVDFAGGWVGRLWSGVFRLRGTLDRYVLSFDGVGRWTVAPLSGSDPGCYRKVCYVRNKPILCPNALCRQPVAKEDRRRKKDRVQAIPPSALVERPNEAQRLRCGHCGKSVVLLKGSLS